MKKILLWGSILIVIILLVVGYVVWRPQQIKQNVVQATDIYMETQESKDPIKLSKALGLVDRAIMLGGNSSTNKLLRGQILVNLGRIEEAKFQYLKVKSDDKTAGLAVDQLMAKLN